MKGNLLKYHIQDGYVYKRHRTGQDVFVISHEYNPIKLSPKDRKYMKKDACYKNNIHLFFTDIEKNFILLFHNKQNKIMRDN